jgi:hypothetical protein
MRTRPILLTTISAALAWSMGGCTTERQQTFDKAIRSTIADLRKGDYESASSTLETARSYADSGDQKSRVAELAILIDGAEAYCRGDRAQASAAWSESRSPEIRRAIASSQGSLGVTLATPTKN